MSWVDRFLAEERELFAYALVLTGQVADAEDLVQLALLRLVRRGIAPDQPLGYLMRTIRNAWIDQQRRAPAVTESAALLLDRPAPDEPTGTTDGVRGALDALAPEEREVIILHFDAQLSLREIAAVLERPVGTVSAICARAKRRMAAHLRSEGRRDVETRS